MTTAATYTIIVAIITILYLTGIVGRYTKLTGIEGISKVAIIIRVTIGLVSIGVTAYATLYKTEAIMLYNHIDPRVASGVAIFMAIFVSLALEASLIFSERAIFESTKRGLGWMLIYITLYSGLTYTNYNTFIWAANVAAEQSKIKYKKESTQDLKYNKDLVHESYIAKEEAKKELEEAKRNKIDYRAYINNNYTTNVNAAELIKLKIGKKNWKLIEEGNSWTRKHFRKEIAKYRKLIAEIEIEKAKAYEKAKAIHRKLIAEKQKAYEKAKLNYKQEYNIKRSRESQIITKANEEGDEVETLIKNIANKIIIISIITAMFIALDSGNIQKVQKIIGEEIESALQFKRRRREEEEEELKGRVEESEAPKIKELAWEEEERETPQEERSEIEMQHKKIEIQNETSNTTSESNNIIEEESKKERVLALMKYAIETDMEYEDEGKKKKLVNWNKINSENPQEAFAITPLHKALKQYYGNEFKIGKTKKPGHLPMIRMELKEELKKWLEDNEKDYGVAI